MTAYEEVIQHGHDLGLMLILNSSKSQRAFPADQQNEYVDYPFKPVASAPRIDLVSEMPERTDPDVYLMNGEDRSISPSNLRIHLGFNLAVSDATPSNRIVPDVRQPE